MSAEYVRALARLGWLLAPLEQGLGELPDGSSIDRREAARLVVARAPSDEEVLAALHGLVALGVLTRHGARWKLDRAKLDATEGYRRGVQDALDVARGEPPPAAPAVCAALPLGLPEATLRRLRATAVDLRATLVDIVAAARARVVLASPFWDVETAEELAALLERRLAAHVRVDLLGRRLRDPGIHLLHARLGAMPGCQVFVWNAPYARDRFRAQTFHFKAVVADHGERAYVGSANLTISGLRSRMELGVVLDGPAAERVSTIVDSVLHVARRCAPPSAAAAAAAGGGEASDGPPVDERKG